MNVNRFAAGALLLAGTMLATTVLATRGPGQEYGGSDAVSTPSNPPLRNWVVDSDAFIAKMPRPKAATDLATVYRPLTPCRLFDTRGFAAALAVPGPFAPNSTTTITPAGACGIPNTSTTKALSLAISVQKLDPGGGYIALQGVGQPVTAIASVLATEWTGTSANVTIVSGGAFDVYLSSVTAHVIVDVNGYYQDLNALDVNTEMDIIGSTTGDLLNVFNSSTGTSLAATASSGTAFSASAGASGTAVLIGSGAFRVSGATVGGTTSFATIHQVNTAVYPTGTICGAGFPDYSVFDHPLANADPNALLIITPRGVLGAGGFNSPIMAYYLPGAGCTSAQSQAKWLIRRMDGAAIPNGAQFNVLIVKPQ